MFEHDLVRFTTDAGLLVAAKRCACRQIVVGIHPHTARADTACDLHGCIDILGEYRAAEAVHAVIGQRDDFVSGLEFLYYDDRSEDFFLAHAAVRLVSDKDGWFHEIALVAAVCRIAFAARHEGRALFDADLDVIQDFILLGFVDLRTELGRWIRRIADLDRFEGRFQVFQEFIEDAFLHEETRAGAADLSLIEEDALAGTVDGLRKVAVVKDDVCGFPAELERTGDELVAGRLIHAVADFGGAGEGELVQIRMVEQPLAGLRALAGDDIDHALRQDVLNETHEFHQRQRCVGGWLHDDGIARRKRRRELPACHGEGEIPRNDLPDHADRFMEDERHGIVIDHRRTAFPRTEAPCKIAEMVAAERNIRCLRLADRLAVVERLHESQVIGIGINDVCDLQKKILSFDRGCLRPSRERCASRFHRFVYIFLRRFRKESEFFAIRWIVRCKCRAVTGWYKITVDKKSVLFLDVCHKNDLPFRNGREKIRVQGSRFRVSPWGVVPFDSV